MLIQKAEPANLHFVLPALAMLIHREPSSFIDRQAEGRDMKWPITKSLISSLVIIF